MKGKHIARLVIFTFVILFSTLYVTQALGYYEYNNKKINTLTEDAVDKFEKDVQSGKSIKASNYLKKENDYNNNLSKGGMMLSRLIEKTFDGIMDSIFKSINNTVNGK